MITIIIIIYDQSFNIVLLPYWHTRIKLSNKIMSSACLALIVDKVNIHIANSAIRLFFPILCLISRVTWLLKDFLKMWYSSTICQEYSLKNLSQSVQNAWKEKLWNYFKLWSLFSLNSIFEVGRHDFLEPNAPILLKFFVLMPNRINQWLTNDV